MQARADRTSLTSMFLVAVAGAAAAVLLANSLGPHRDLAMVSPAQIDSQVVAHPEAAAKAAPPTASLPRPTLPQGAIARLGRGSLRGFAVASSTLAVATSTGLEVYDDGQDLLWAVSTAAPVTGVALSPEGAYLATLTESTVEVLRAAPGEALFSLDLGRQEVRQLAFQPASDRLAVAVEGEVRFYGLPDGNLQETVTAGAKVLDPAWAPDGSSLLLGTTDLLRRIPARKPIPVGRHAAADQR